MPKLESSLLAAVQPHDLLSHPFYRAWSMGQLTTADLAGYAAQYRYQVDSLPALLRAARDAARDDSARAALERNLDEEEGRSGPAHAELWSRFADAVGSVPEAADDETRRAGDALSALCSEGEIEALAALWSYEMQTARVAQTKRLGLIDRYGVSEVSFFALHENLDVLHAADLLAAVEQRCGGDPDLAERARDAARRSAQAQWLFLDGAERRRRRKA